LGSSQLDAQASRGVRPCSTRKNPSVNNRFPGEFQRPKNFPLNINHEHLGDQVRSLEISYMSIQIN
jgi:hypothetical protein